MGLFVCAKCNCIENTALGLYWTYQHTDLFRFDFSNEQFKGKPLCSECGPKEFNDGSLTGFGRWHGKFDKENINDIPEEEKKSIYLK